MPEELVPTFGANIVLDDPKRPSWVLSRVDALVQVVKESYVELTELLWEVKTKEYFRKVKDKDGEAYDRFQDWVEDQLGWKDRKAEYFVSIHENLTLAGAPKKALATIEWSKASQLTALPEAERQPGKIEGWIKKAQDLRFLDLKSEVVNARNVSKAAEEGRKKPEEVEPKVKAEFYLAPPQAANVQLAITTAMKVSGSDKKGHCLDLICTEFLTGRAEEAGVKMHRILSSVERIFGVTVVAVKIKGDDTEIVYGQKFAKKHGIE